MVIDMKGLFRISSQNVQWKRRWRIKGKLGFCRASQDSWEDCGPRSLYLLAEF